MIGKTADPEQLEIFRQIYEILDKQNLIMNVSNLIQLSQVA